MKHDIALLAAFFRYSSGYADAAGLICLSYYLGTWRSATSSTSTAINSTTTAGTTIFSTLPLLRLLDYRNILPITIAVNNLRTSSP